jgi:integrase/recombinase XerD
MKSTSFLNEIQHFLTKYCQDERRLSRQTVLSYRDTIKIFIRYQSEEKNRKPTELKMEHLSYDGVLEFLNYLERDRKSSVSTRNQRLSALKALSKLIMLRNPEFVDSLSRVLAIPLKKKFKRNRTFLEKDEVNAILSSVNQSTWVGQRNYLMLAFAIRTGVRVTELVELKTGSVTFGKSPYVTVLGKGRKERSIPLEKPFARELTRWISQMPASNTILFPTSRGTKLSVDAVQSALRKVVRIAAKTLPGMNKKRISPHTLRHTTAMQMLERGVDVQIIALWLGHEQIDTTQVYLSESLTLKRKALSRTRLKSDWKPSPTKRSETSFLDEL